MGFRTRVCNFLSTAPSANERVHAVDKGQRAAVHFYAFPLLRQRRMRYIGTGAQALPCVQVCPPLLKAKA